MKGKMFSYLLTLGLICAAYSHTEDDKCRKLIKTFEQFDCVAISECSILEKSVHDGKVVRCGIDDVTGTAKVCCPKRFRRVLKQPCTCAPQKDPYAIAGQKCGEYAGARYVTTPLPLPNQPDNTTKKIDCIYEERSYYRAFIFVRGGIKAQLKEFPHMALIGFSDHPEKPVNDTQWGCGGSLISDRYVLTAAHCMRHGDYEAMWVRLGELVLNNDFDFSQPRDFRIAERIPHPQYTASSVYFDIMLLKLQNKVDFTPHMRPICLHTSSELASDLRKRALITGWGATGADEQQSEALLKAEVDFSEDDECIATYKGDIKLANGYDPATMVCAVNKLYGNDTCTGDSGGPLQVKILDWACEYYSQVGVTSYGAAICGQKNVSSIYTKVWPFIPWIQSIVWP